MLTDKPFLNVFLWSGQFFEGNSYYGTETFLFSKFRELVESTHRGFLLFMTCLKHALPAAGGSVVTIACGKITQQLHRSKSIYFKTLRLSPWDTVCPTINLLIFTAWSILQEQFTGQKIVHLDPQIVCVNMGICKASGAI